MTISQQPPHNASLPDASRSFLIPARPAVPPAGGQPLPTWQRADNAPDARQSQVQQDRPDISEQATSVLPARPSHSQRPPAEADRAWQNSWSAPPLRQAGAPSPAPAGPFPAQPLPAPTTQIYRLSPAPPAPPARKRRGRLYLVLASLAILVVLGGLLSQQLLSRSGGSQADGPLNYPSNGPFAQFPLSASQINAIQHLSGHMKYKALASLYVSHMSLDEEIGQLIMVEYNQPTYSSDLDYMIHTLHAGGVIMYEFQMNTFNQTKADIAHMQQRATIPLIITTDEEGGPYVRRLDHIYGYRMSPTQIEETGDVNVATQQGLKVSKDLAALGLNSDLAPDVDVNQVNGYDMVTRTFGNTPAQVIKFAGAYMQAMQGNGTIACIKHYPGLGGATPDAHKTLPVVNSTRQQIYDIDLAPFKAFIQSPNALLNPGMIMPTDILMPAIDPKYPAELSHIFMTDILRKEFGYDGVVLTDALYMQGITNTWDMYTASVMALQAGDDMLLGANGTQQTLGVINAIKQALKDGRLTKARIDESVTRIIALKMQYHLMPTYIPGL
jgi:beta-N-acetylhexosaminidase